MGPQEDYIETVFTCEGDYHDPHLKDRLEDFKRSLKDLLLTDKSKLILKKVEPWNSVRVTFKIPREAAVRLKQLAQQGNTTLKELGVLAVQIQGQNISLTIAGKNNEHTQLVFRTAEPAQATATSVSVLRTNSPALEGLGPHGPGPGPSPLDAATSKNIAEYLQMLLPGHVPDAQKAKKNNILPIHGVDQHKPPLQSPQPSHHGLPSSSSPSTNSMSPSQSPGAQIGPKYPQLTSPAGLPTGLPPGPHMPGLDNLPPPPPYPGESSAYMNNIQKLPFPAAGSPLIMNLLKNDPTLSSLISSNKLPANYDPEALQGAKKKRKPRKQREKKKKDGEQVATSMPGVVPSSTSVDLVTRISPVSTPAPSAAQIVNRDFNPAHKEHGFHSVPQALLHNTSVQNVAEQIVPLTSPVVNTKKVDESDTAGKIINPVTGLLEPVELSDTSPAKSDSDKLSPRSLAQRKVHIGEERMEDLSVKTSIMASVQGRHPQQIQRSISEHADHHGIHSVGLVHKSLSSSQITNSEASGLAQLHFQESLKNNIIKTHRKNDIIPSVDKLEQILPRSTGKIEMTVETKCDIKSAVGLQTSSAEVHKKVHIAQEVDTNPIPSQLLNKPLLQVKHNSVLGKPSDSPESNGDSECSSQGIMLDTHNCPDTGGHSGSQGDPRSYNTDSGVGSCSERSDDTPSEHGDSDFKSGTTLTYECAKTVGIDTLKQPPPNSKIMTVGYAIEESVGQKDIKNHKFVSSFHGSEKINTALNLTKLKSEKSDVCSTSQSQVLNWNTDDQHMIANNVNVLMKHAAAAANESLKRKSPKLASSGHNSISHVIDSMQGTSEMSMQKKKTSPRNSPRNPSSPRNPCSPRGGGSPRGDVLPGTPGRQPFLTNQDILEAHLSRESHSKSYREGGRSPLLEQRKSPFNMMSAANSIPAVAGNLPNLIAGHEPMHHISVDTVRMSAQCNIDNIALLKSAQMMAFSNAPNDNSAFLQKLEELKPLLQKLKNPTAPMSVVPNGLESVSRLSKSPGPAGAQTKTSNHSDAHTVNSIAVTSNSVNAGHCVTNVLTSNSNNSVPSSVSKVSKANSEDQKGSSSANARRSSPGSATSSSNPIHSFDSSLPPPKRLTESVQKLLNFPLDPSNPLPHHRRSPQSCASVTRTCSSQVTAQCNVTTRGVTPTFVPSSVQGLVSSKHPSTDTTHIDLDSINPSITAVGGLGPIMLPLDTSQNACMDVTVPAYSNMQHLSLTDTLPVNLDYQGVVSNLTTKLVPAVKGSISSHKSGESAVSSKPVSDSQINQLLNKNTSVSVAATAVVKTTVCNSDSKMAVVSATTTVDSQNKTLTSSIDTSGPPVLQPVQSQASVRYPVPVISDKPKVGYPQMLLSEMLQETATPFRLTERPPITAAQATSTVQSTVSSVQVTAQVKVSSTTTVATSDNSSINKETVAVEKNVETVTLKTEVVASSAGSGLKESNCKSSADQTVKTSDTDSGKKNTNDNSDIPKLKRQTNLSVHIGRTNSSPISTPVLGSDSCDSDMGKSQDSCSSSSSTPPVLTAVSDIPEIKRGSTSESDIESKDNNSLDTVNQSSASSNVTPQSQTNTDPVKTKLANISNDDNPPDLTHTRTAVELSDKKINSMSEDTEVSHVSHVKGGKSLRKRRASSESVEEKQDDHDLAPRQLRSRKRTNPHDNDSGTAEDSKRPKLDPGSESTVSQPKETKDSKTAANAETSNDESNSHNDSIKSGLRTRTNTKLPSTDNSDKSKPPTGRETRKDGKVQAAKVPEKKPELVKQEDNKRTPQSRRNRQSPSVQTPEKTAPAAVNREKSPLRGGRTRGRNSPVTVENSEESQENKRTTRSAKSKEVKAEPPGQPPGKSVMSAAKRRRTSTDHR